MGSGLIKRAAAAIAAELPSVETFATLSPIPGFARWLDSGGAWNDNGLTASEASKLSAIAPDLGIVEAAPSSQLVLEILLSNLKGVGIETAGPKVVELMMELVARYLLTVRRIRNRDGMQKECAYDSVADFHLVRAISIVSLIATRPTPLINPPHSHPLCAPLPTFLDAWRWRWISEMVRPFLPFIGQPTALAMVLNNPMV